MISTTRTPYVERQLKPEMTDILVYHVTSRDHLIIMIPSCSLRALSLSGWDPWKVFNEPCVDM